MKTKITKIALASALALLALYAQADMNDTSMKVRGGFLHTAEDIKTGSASTASSQSFKNGYVAEFAMNHFFDKNFGVELSAGYGRTKFKNNAGTNKNVSFVPLTATLQARHNGGTMVPYVGVGYSHQLFSNGAGSTKIKNGGGVVAQIGMDYMMSDEMGLNIDVKHTFKVAHKITEGSETFKNDMSTTTALAGVVFKF